MRVSSLLGKFAMNTSQVHTVRLLDGSHMYKEIPFNIAIDPRNKEYSYHEYLGATVEAFWVNGPTMTIMVKGVYEV